MNPQLSTWTARLHAWPTAHVLARLHRRTRASRRADDGYTAETVVITALLVTGAVIIVGIILAKITSIANGIQM